MWKKKTNTEYIKATAKYRRSGTHNPDFACFVMGQTTSLYIFYWLAVKQDLTSFVSGGLFEDDGFDSLESQLRPDLYVGNRAAEWLRETPPNPRKRSRHEDTPIQTRTPVTPFTPTTRYQPQTPGDSKDMKELIGSLKAHLDNFAVAVERPVEDRNKLAGTVEDMNNMVNYVTTIERELEDATGQNKAKLEAKLELYIKIRNNLIRKFLP